MQFGEKVMICFMNVFSKLQSGKHLFQRFSIKFDQINIRTLKFVDIFLFLNLIDLRSKLIPGVYASFVNAFQTKISGFVPRNV